MPAHDPVQVRNVLDDNVVDKNLGHLRAREGGGGRPGDVVQRQVVVPEEEQVAALEGGLHPAAEVSVCAGEVLSGQHNDDGRRAVGGDAEALPEHERGREDQAKVEQLGEELARLELRKPSEAELGEEGVHWCGMVVVAAAGRMRSYR